MKKKSLKILRFKQKIQKKCLVREGYGQKRPSKVPSPRRHVEPRAINESRSGSGPERAKVQRCKGAAILHLEYIKFYYKRMYSRCKKAAPLHLCTFALSGPEPDLLSLIALGSTCLLGEGTFEGRFCP